MPREDGELQLQVLIAQNKSSKRRHRQSEERISQGMECKPVSSQRSDPNSNSCESQHARGAILQQSSISSGLVSSAEAFPGPGDGIGPKRSPREGSSLQRRVSCGVLLAAGDTVGRRGHFTGRGKYVPADVD